MSPLYKKKLTVSASKLLPLFKLLENATINVENFLKTEAVDPGIVASPDLRIPLQKVHQLNQKATFLIGDEDLGLHQGEIFIGLSNILGYVLMNCRNLEEVLEKYVKYQSIADEGRELEYYIADSQVILKYIIRDEKFAADKHLIDHQLAGMLTYQKILTGKDIPLDEAHFIYEKPKNVSEYERIFQCRLIFNSKMNAIIFNKNLLELPILQPNRDLLLVFEQYADKVLEKIIKHNSYTEKVSRIIVSLIKGESPTIDMVAKELGMSTRTLQTKLNHESTTFSNVLNNIRKEMAIEYLKDNTIPIEEITYMLGFSEPSVFHRTFKRWTKYSPGKYRKIALNR